ncbi:hypothetical protein BGZ88_009937 [Linnemannia elongata]|nr:hypothetical protein BGZ88_009937 [Linnemannia elongata]
MARAKGRFHSAPRVIFYTLSGNTKRFNVNLTYKSFQQSIIADLDSLSECLKSEKVAPSRLHPNKVKANTRILTRSVSPVLSPPSSALSMTLSSSETAPLAIESATTNFSLPLEGHHETSLSNADLTNNTQTCEGCLGKNKISSRVPSDMTASNGYPTTQRGDLSAVSGCESDNQSPANNSDVNCVDPYGTTVNQKSYSQLPTPPVCVQAEKHLESSSENKVTHVVAMPAHQPSKFPRLDSGKPLACSPWMIPRLLPTSFALDQPLHARDVESLLKELRYKKVREYSLPNFTPLRAKATLRDSNDNSFPLLDKVNNFLESKNEVFLILGDAGSGKTSFCKHLDYIFWNSYKPGGMIPVHIDLHTIYRPEHDLIKKQLRADGFSNVKIQEMLHNRQFLLICDGYDECGITTNLHTTNKLNRTGQRNVKMVISCRTTLFSRGYQGLFHPHGADKYHDTSSDLFEEATIVPFTEDDVKAYIHQYICGTAMQDLANGRPRWTVEKFMDTFSTITGLSGLVKNPFVLWLALRVLPSLMSDALASTAKNGTTRAQLLDRFFENWVGVNKSRIQRRTKLKPKVFTVFQDLCDSEGGFKGCVTDFLTNLSAAMFEHQGYSPVVNYEHVKEEITWKGEFFGRTIKSTLLRDASPLNRAGDQYRFIHDTFFDYFRSLAFYTPDQGEDDGSEDGEDNDSDDSQGDDSNSSEGDETDDGDEEDSDSSEMDDSGEGAGNNEGDGGGILEWWTPERKVLLVWWKRRFIWWERRYVWRKQWLDTQWRWIFPWGHGDGNWSGGNGDATNGERGSNGLFSGSSGGSSGSGGNDNNSNGGKDDSKEDKNSPRKGKDDSRSKKKDRSTKSRSSKSNDSFSRQNVFKDPHVLELLVDRVHSDPRFEKRLFVNIEQSKMSAVPSLAAANSITILYMAGKSFRDVDLDGVKIPYDYMLDGGHGTPNSVRSLSNALMASSSSRSMGDYPHAQGPDSANDQLRGPTIPPLAALLSGAEGKPQFFGWESRADRLGPLIPRPTGVDPDDAPGEKRPPLQFKGSAILPSVLPPLISPAPSSSSSLSILSCASGLLSGSMQHSFPRICGFDAADVPPRFPAPPAVKFSYGPRFSHCLKRPQDNSDDIEGGESRKRVFPRDSAESFQQRSYGSGGAAPPVSSAPSYGSSQFYGYNAPPPPPPQSFAPQNHHYSSLDMDRSSRHNEYTHRGGWSNSQSSSSSSSMAHGGFNYRTSTSRPYSRAQSPIMGIKPPSWYQDYANSVHSKPRTQPAYQQRLDFDYIEGSNSQHYQQQLQRHHHHSSHVYEGSSLTRIHEMDEDDGSHHLHRLSKTSGSKRSHNSGYDTSPSVHPFDTVDPSATGSLSSESKKPMWIKDAAGQVDMISMDDDFYAVKTKRKRVNASQLSVLNASFERSYFPSIEERLQLSKQCQMDPRTVQIWFQNKRQSVRARSKAMEAAVSGTDITDELLEQRLQVLEEEEQSLGMDGQKRSTNNMADEDYDEEEDESGPVEYSSEKPSHHRHHHGGSGGSSGGKQRRSSGNNTGASNGTSNGPTPSDAVMSALHIQLDDRSVDYFSRKRRATIVKAWSEQKKEKEEQQSEREQEHQLVIQQHQKHQQE